MHSDLPINVHFEKLNTLMSDPGLCTRIILSPIVLYINSVEVNNRGNLICILYLKLLLCILTPHNGNGEHFQSNV